MSTFLKSIEFCSRKLKKQIVIVNLWKEIISGEKAFINQEDLINYSLHYPIDTCMYLEDLLRKFVHLDKRELCNIDGNLKIYIQTFLYYCISSQNERIPLKCSLLAAELYLRIILEPSSVAIAEIYFEKKIYEKLLYLLNRTISLETVPEELLFTVLTLTFSYISIPRSSQSLSLLLVKGTLNIYGNLIKYRIKYGKVKEDFNEDKLVQFSCESLHNFINNRTDVTEIQFAMESLLRCMKNIGKATADERKLAARKIIKFIKKVILKTDNYFKTYCLIEVVLLRIICTDEFDDIENIVLLINCFSEQLYKDFLFEVPKYLKSSEIKPEYIINLMNIIYSLLETERQRNFNKLDVLYGGCISSIFFHLKNENQEIVNHTIKILAQTCAMNDYCCPVVTEIFRDINLTNDLGGLKVNAILNVFISILKAQIMDHNARSNDILTILAKFLVNVDNINENLASEIIFLIAKNRNPFDVGYILPQLDKLFLQLSGKSSKSLIRLTIVRIIYKMAMKDDTGSRTFLMHLYNSCIFARKIDNVEYGPEEYANELFSEKFDYEAFTLKAQDLIQDHHVQQVLKSLKSTELGIVKVLHGLVKHSNFKETELITEYILDHFDEVIKEESIGYLLDVHRMILNRAINEDAIIKEKLKLIYQKLWNSLLQSECHNEIFSTVFTFLDYLQELLNFEPDTEKRTELLRTYSINSYRDLQNQTYDTGSIINLSELCVALKRFPSAEILQIFDRLLRNEHSLARLTTDANGHTLMHLLYFYGNLSAIDSMLIPFTVALFENVINTTSSSYLQLPAIKMYSKICFDVTHEYEVLTEFCFKNIEYDNPPMIRTCLSILEKLTYLGEIRFTSETFLKFVFRMGCDLTGPFAISILSQRFINLQKTAIEEFFMYTLIYISGYEHLRNYPIQESFSVPLSVLNDKIHNVNDLIRVLFSALNLEAQFKILSQLCDIFDQFVTGNINLTNNFFLLFDYSLYSIKVMGGKSDFSYQRTSFYSDIIEDIEEQIFKHDPNYEYIPNLANYLDTIMKCTKSLLILHSFIRSTPIFNVHAFLLFDTIICWIPRIKSELINAVYNGRGIEFDTQLRRFVSFFKDNRIPLTHYLDNS